MVTLILISRMYLTVLRNTLGQQTSSNSIKTKTSTTSKEKTKLNTSA